MTPTIESYDYDSLDVNDIDYINEQRSDQGVQPVIDDLIIL